MLVGAMGLEPTCTSYPSNAPLIRRLGYTPLANLIAASSYCRLARSKSLLLGSHHTASGLGADIFQIIAEASYILLSESALFLLLFFPRFFSFLAGTKFR